MIERASEFGASAAVPLVAGDSTHMTAGNMLREAREAHGLHIEMVAAALKVAPQKLEALEADDIDALPDRVFARALAASVCRALRIDPAPVLAKLPTIQRPGLADADQTISRSLRSSAPRSGSGTAGWRPSRALLAMVALLLVGAGILFWLPQSAFDQVGASISRLTQSDSASTEAASSAAPVAAGTAVESVAPGAAPVMPPPLEAAAPAPEPAAVAAAPTTAEGSDLIVFAARDEVWITVTDPAGKQLLRRTVKAGETVGVTGSLPLSVVIGRASAVDVRVRGKAFDLAPLTKAGGVARFDVKS